MDVLESAVRLAVAAGANRSFTDAGVPDTSETRRQWSEITAALRNLPANAEMDLPFGALPFTSPRVSEKQLRRIVDITGQAVLQDVPENRGPAAGGGGMQMPPQPVPGGVPGLTAGAEPPRWDGGQPQPRVMSAPQVVNDQGVAPTAGRVASPRPHAAWPALYMDGWWPQGGHGTEQASESSPGGKTGVPPRGMGVADLKKVGKEGYIHGYICVQPPCGKYNQAIHRKTFATAGDVLHSDTGERIGSYRLHSSGRWFAQVLSPDGSRTTKLWAESPDAAIRDIIAHRNISMLAEDADSRGHGDVAAMLRVSAADVQHGDHDELPDDLESALSLASEYTDHDGPVLEQHIADIRDALRDGTISARDPEPDAGADENPMPHDVAAKIATLISIAQRRTGDRTDADNTAHVHMNAALKALSDGNTEKAASLTSQAIAASHRAAQSDELRDADYALRQYAGGVPGDEMSAGRVSDITRPDADSFMATGDPHSVETVESFDDDRKEAVKFKRMVAERLEREMHDVNTQDLARAALGNENRRTHPDVAEFVVGAGPSAVYASDYDEPHAKFQVADDTARSALYMMRSRIKMVHNYGLGDTDTVEQLGLDAPSLRDNYGMPEDDIADLLRTADAGMERAHDVMVTGGDDKLGVQNDSTMQDLNARGEGILQAHYDRILARSGTSPNGGLSADDERELRRSFIGDLVNLWAESANDDHAASLAVQHAAQDEFNLGDVQPWDMNSDTDVAASKYYDENKHALHRYVRAQYELTQHDLRNAGITSVPLYRAMAFEDAAPDWLSERKPGAPMKQSGHIVHMKSSDWRPISSWSHSKAEASHFFGNMTDGSGVILKASVPAERVFSTPRSGAGCLNEREWVVMAAPGTASVEDSRNGRHNNDGYGSGVYDEY